MSLRRATGEGQREIARQPENKLDLNGDHIKSITETSWSKTRAVRKTYRNSVGSLKCFSFVNRNEMFDCWPLRFVDISPSWVPDFAPKKKISSSVSIE